VIAITIVLVTLKVTKAKSVMLISRVDSQRARAQAAERVAFRVTDVAEKAVNVALEIQEVNDKVDELLALERAASEAKPGRHALRVVSDDQQGYVA
jgi:hypothetical protein